MFLRRAFHYLYEQFKCSEIFLGFNGVSKAISFQYSQQIALGASKVIS